MKEKMIQREYLYIDDNRDECVVCELLQGSQSCRIAIKLFFFDKEITSEPYLGSIGKEEDVRAIMQEAVDKNAKKIKKFADEPYGYYVYRAWCYQPDANGDIMDIRTVGKARRGSWYRNGDNMVGRSDGFNFNTYEDLPEAIAQIGKEEVHKFKIELEGMDATMAKKLLRMIELRG